MSGSSDKGKRGTCAVIGLLSLAPALTSNEALRGHSGSLAQMSFPPPDGMMGGMPTIYIALKDESVDVWRPVEAVSEGESVYRITAAAVPVDEAWEFPPGSLVRCEWRDLSERRALVAVAPA